MRQEMRRRSFAVALGALLAALGAALMALGSLVSALAYSVPLFAALLLIPALCELGRRGGVMVWLVTAILSLLLCADKELPALYIFLCHYPLLKDRFDRIRPPRLAAAAKALWFALMQGLMYALLCFVFRLPDVIRDFQSTSLVINVLSFLMLVFVMTIYDRIVERFTLLYRLKLRPRLRFR